MRHQIPQPGGHNDADQRRHERHKWQDGFEHRIDGVAPGLEQHGNAGAHTHTDFRQQAVALFGDFFGGVVVAPCRRRRRFRRRRFRFRGVCAFNNNVMLTHTGNVNIFGNKLRQRARLAGRMDVYGRDAPFRVDTAAQRAAAVDDRHTDFFRRRFAFFKTIHRFPAGQFRQLVDNRRARARRDIHHFFAGHRVNQQRTTPATFTPVNTDRNAHFLLRFLELDFE